jgi:acetyl-CoA acetyltransferase
MYTYGTTQEQLGAVCVLCRGNAATNPRAVWQEAITLEQYMSSRWVATPFKLLDCDYPIDGAAAVIISSADAAAETRLPVAVEATGHATSPDTSWTNWPDLATMCSHYVAADLWQKTEIRPTDVDVAELYDGFSWLAIAWLEDLGFVPKGEGGPFFETGGGRIGSPLAVCTDGGQLGMGRLHGFGKVAQAVAQLRGEAGANQVPKAEIAIATAGGGPGGSAILLSRPR